MSMQIENLTNYELAIRERNEARAELEKVKAELNGALFAANQHLQTVETQARIIANNPEQAPIQSGADSKPDLSDLARLFADAFESRKALTLSPDSCGQLFYAMTTPPAAQQQASTAQEQAAIVPAGWKLVPVSPTMRMTEAGRDARLAGATHMDSLVQWRAMLAAAPPPPVAQAHALTDAARDVLTERQRQVSAEGWTPEHDDEHSGGDLAVAAACYAVENSQRLASKPPQSWPWGAIWWKPKGNRQNLVRAGALILAEIERLDRAAHLARKG